MQVVLVYLEWFRCNSLFKCVLQPKIAKNSLKPLFWGSRSFKVIDVGTTGKLISSACYGKQQASLCLSTTVFMLDEPIVIKWRFLTGIPLFDALVWG